MTYAAKTKVSVQTTRQGIEKVLRKAGADRIVTMDEPHEAIVAFRHADRLIRMRVDMLADGSDQWRRTLWRNIDLIVRAKLAAAAEGVSTIEREFLAFVVLPNGSTVGEDVLPKLERLADRGELPKLLPDFSGGRT